MENYKKIETDLLESLREDFEAAERELMAYESNSDTQSARFYRHGVSESFLKVYKILEKALV